MRFISANGREWFTDRALVHWNSAVLYSRCKWPNDEEQTIYHLFMYHWFLSAADEATEP